MLSDICKTKINALLNLTNNEFQTEIKLLNSNKNDNFSDDDTRLLYLLYILSQNIGTDYKTDPPLFKNFQSFDEINNYLETIVIIVSDTYLKAKIYDFFWINSSKRTKYEFVKKAYALYKETILDSNNFEDMFFLLNRLICLYTSTTPKAQCKNELNPLIKRVLIQGKNNTTMLPYIILKMCYDEGFLSLDELIQECMAHFLLIKESNNLFFIAYPTLLETLYAKKYKIKLTSKPTPNIEISNIRREKGNFYLQIANNQLLNNQKYEYIQTLKDTIQTLKQIQGTDIERQKLLKKLSNTQKELALNIKSIPICNIDISDITKKTEETLSGLSVKESILFLLSFLGIEKKSSIKKSFIEDYSTFSFHQLFSTSFSDKNGKTRVILPALDEKNLSNDALLLPYLEDRLKNTYNFNAHLIQNTIYCINIKSVISESDITDLINTSIFVPESRRKSFIKGLMAGFNKDFITALNILIPQVENSIRYLAEACGDIIYNLDDGIEKLKTLHAILDLPNLTNALDEDLLFNLKAIFTSQYCLNMRNEIAHGTIDDINFSSFEALYTWWFIFKTCYMFCLFDSK